MAIQQSLDNLMTFPFVASAIKDGSLNIEGAWFSIAEGKLQWLDWDSGTFGDVASSTESASSGGAS